MTAAKIAPEVRARFIEPLERETSLSETSATKRRDKNAKKKKRR